MTIVYPFEESMGESFVVGYRNYAGGGQIWTGADTIEAARKQLAKARAEYANQPAVTHRANVPVTWYIERRVEVVRVELVSEVLASEPLP
jgi:hypothetical protein